MSNQIMFANLPRRVIQNSPIVSSAQQAQLRYVEYVSLDPSVGTALDYIFLANSCYDPNYSGTGHQPMGFDQWMTFYDHFHVISSTIKATFTSNTATATNQSAVCGVQLRDNSTTVSASDITIILEQGTLANSHYKVLPIVNARPSATIRARYTPNSFFGVHSLADSSILRGTSSADCSDLAYYHVWYGPMSGGLDLPAAIVLIEITYTVLFTEPRCLPQS
jgi:hypothetical protein